MSKKIPKFKSYEEEVAFWDSTSLDEIDPSEFEELTIDKPIGPLSATIAVRFDARTMERLRAAAEVRGVGYTQLLRSWVMERLDVESPVPRGRRSQRTKAQAAVRDKVTRAVMARMPAFVEEVTQAVLKETAGKR